MEGITPQQIKKVRAHLNMSQAQFAEEMGVSRSCVGQWESGNSNPRGGNLTALIELYEENLSNKPNGKAKTNGSKSNGHAAKGGRHKVSVTRTQERVSEVTQYLMVTQAETVARKVAEQSEIEFVTFREALVVFLYSMDNMSASHIAQALAGHE